MDEKKEKIVTLIAQKSQETLDAIQKLVEEAIEIPRNLKRKAFRELEKTKSKIEKMISKELGNHTNLPPTI
ncbi:MAG: hypothetical protein LBH08_03340 [Puniceicoccales bacterium]|jgi:hypothetical protein|nr:hypothetical protein [Puniceicoccales bacterium]